MADLQEWIDNYPGDTEALRDALFVECERLSNRVDRMEGALHQIDSWSRAYPLKVFPEPDMAKAAELLKAGGMMLDAISASNMRHVVEGVGKIARAALTGNREGETGNG